MYTLLAQIDSADLPGIRKAGEKIVLVKNIGQGVPVAWTTLSPLENNQFEWGGAYALFATTVGDQVGARVTMMSYTQAQGGCRYAFGNPLMFGPGVPDPSIGPNDYCVDNRVPPGVTGDLSFGLAQAISGSDGMQPLNAQYVPSMQSFTQGASDSVTIWLQSDVDAGDIVTIPPLEALAVGGSIRSNALIVNFSGGATAQTVKYSSKLGRFELA